MNSLVKWMTLPAAFIVGMSFAQADEMMSEMEHVIHEKNRSVYVLTYQESGLWRTQVVEVKPDQLQKTIRSENFVDSASAKKSHEKALRDFNYVAPAPGEEADMAVSAAMDISAKETGESIWPVARDAAWTPEWEAKFSQWVASTITPEYFIKHNLKTDCADVIISLRWIFARDNGLPIANTLNITHEMVGHMTMAPEWRNLPTAQNWYEDQKFLAALNYVLDHTYTRSLSWDSYPIAINRGSVIPGSHHLQFHERGGHAALVKVVEISKSSARIRTLNSTLPRDVRRLAWKDFVHGEQASPGNGFQRMKWPVLEGNRWIFMEDNRYPGYSEEQYAAEFMNGQGTFSAAVAAHLSGNMQLDVKEWKNTLATLETLLKNRANAVYDGYHFCQQADCAPGTTAWDKWSTPGRDDDLAKLVRGVIKTVELHPDNKNAMRAWTDFLKKSFPYDAGRGQTLTNKDALSAVANGRLESDPRVSIAQRWGLETQ